MNTTSYSLENTTNELESFRRQWREELLSKTGAPATAAQNNRSSYVSPSEPFQQHESGSAFKSAEVEHLATNISEMSINSSSPPIKSRPLLAYADNAMQSSTDDNALKIYIQGVQAEAEGNLSGALVKYRQAFKLDNHVDVAYRKFYHSNLNIPEKVKVSNAKFDTLSRPKSIMGPKSGEDSASAIANGNNLTTILLNHLREHPPSITAEDESKICHLAELPIELLPLIFLPIFISGDTSLTLRIACTCKAFFLMIFGNDNGWRELCKGVFLNPRKKAFTWDSNGKSILKSSRMESFQIDNRYPRGYPIETELILERLCLEFYAKSYRQMYLIFQRIRTDGCYISTCHYLRQGSSDNSWYQPVHLIRFHRYLRFWGDGHVVALLTTDEPKDIVRRIGHRTPHHNETGAAVDHDEDEFSWWKGRGLSYGRWWIEYNEKYGLSNGEIHDPVVNIDDNTRCHVPWAGEEARVHCMMHNRDIGQRHTFFMVLTIRNAGNSKGSVHGRLKWVEYYSINNVTGDRSIYHSSLSSGASANANSGVGIVDVTRRGNSDHQRDFIFSKVRSYDQGHVY